jgi:hypothetical protein
MKKREESRLTQINLVAGQAYDVFIRIYVRKGKICRE